MGEHKRKKTPRGGHVRQIMVPDGLTSALKTQQEERFYEKFGRKPGPDDPLFFDPDSPEPKPIEGRKLLEPLIKLAGRVGIKPSLLYATHKTGRMVTTETYRHLTREEQQEWDDAIDEYYRLEKENSTPQ